MPLREPRMDEDRNIINKLLGWSGVTIASIYRFISGIEFDNFNIVNDVYVYNRGYVELEDTTRRGRDCIMLSIWSKEINNPNSKCLFQQPIPIKMRIEM